MDNTYSENDEPTVIERDEPSVARKSRLHIVIMFIFGLIGLCSIVLLAYHELTKGNDGEAQALNETTRIVNKSSAAKGYIAPAPEASAPVSNTSEPPAKDDSESRLQRMLKEQALRDMLEDQKMMKKRLLSDQVVYDNAATGDMPANLNVSASASGTRSSSSLVENASALDSEALPTPSSDAPKKVGAVQLTDQHGLITQGTMISGIMETAITSNLPGMTRAIISEDVYSFDKSNLLIPTGSHLVGQYRSAVRQGQSRVFIIWNRLIRPDGVSINLASFGTDSLGRSGLEGEVDTHFWERFGASVMLSLIDASAQVAVQSANDSDTNVALNTGEGLSNASEIALENSINIPPTINIDQGQRIKVFVGHDLDFSTVENTAWYD